MADEKNNIPELTLSPDTAAAEAVPQLTLTPDAPAAPAQEEAKSEVPPVQMDEKLLSDAEKQAVEAFSKKIDLTDSQMILQYGAAAQKNVAGFSENALNSVRTKDLGEVGKSLSELVVELKGFGEEEEKKGNHVTQVEGGYRRVVAAPKPVDIVEKDAIKALVDADQVVIACGGGGIPVLAQDNKLQGASAVIEKDLAAGKLADTLDADRLVILTSVDKVCLNYGKEDEKPLDTMTVDEAKKYLAAGEFDEGTMAPKIEAAIDFIGDSAIRSVLITKLNKEGKTVSGGMGTLITK